MTMTKNLGLFQHTHTNKHMKLQKKGPEKKELKNEVRISFKRKSKYKRKLPWQLQAYA